MDNGEFTIADPARTVEVYELPTKADRVDYNPVDVAEPEMTPNVEQYLNLKAQYPDRLIGVQVGDYMMFYGKDAEEAALALQNNFITREIDGLGETPVTDKAGAWQAILKDLLNHGNREWFFQHRNGGKLPTEWVRYQFGQAWVRSGLSTGKNSPRPYDLRHSFATRTLMRWVDEKRDIMALIRFKCRSFQKMAFSLYGTPRIG